MSDIDNSQRILNRLDGFGDAFFEFKEILNAINKRMDQQEKILQGMNDLAQLTKRFDQAETFAFTVKWVATGVGGILLLLGIVGWERISAIPTESAKVEARLLAHEKELQVMNREIEKLQGIIQNGIKRGAITGDPDKVRINFSDQEYPPPVIDIPQPPPDLIRT